MRLFGRSKKEVWKQLSKEINANYIAGSILKESRIEYNYKNWTIYLDTYTVSTGKSSITYTRMRIPFINLKKFYFKVYRKGIFSNIGKAFGMQDIEIGYDYFDNDYIIKGNDEILLRRLFQNHKIRNLIEIQPKIVFEIKDNEGSFGPKFNENESVLSFIVVGVIKDKEKLLSLFELFKKVITELEIMEVTENKIPNVKLYNN